MRNRAILLSILTCLSLHTQAETKYLSFSEGNTTEQVTSAHKTINENESYIDVTYHFDGASITKTNKGDILSMENSLQTLTPGEPMLPYYCDVFLVPSMDATIEELNSEFTEFDDVDIIPFLDEKIPNDETTNNKVERNEVYQTNKFYPSKAVNSNGFNEFHEANLLYVNTYPIQTNPVTKKIRCYTSITYRIQFKYNSLPKIESNTLEMVSEIISNKSSIKLYEGQQPQYLPGATMTGNENRQNYVFITIPSLVEPTKKFAEWKTTMGFRCTIISDPEWTKYKVKDSINAFKKNQIINYLLIVGDSYQIPADLITVEGYNSLGYDKNQIWTDKSYSAKETGSTTPTFTIGRISSKSSTKEEIESIFTKIRKYESEPPVKDDFYQNSLHIATFCDLSTSNKTPDGIESMNAVALSEKIRENVKMNKGINVNRIYTKDSDITPTTDFYGNSIEYKNISWEHETKDISNAINDGQLYVLYTGHGESNQWESPLYSTYDVDSLSNSDLLPVIFSGACYISDFQNGYSLTESFLSNAQGGAVGIVGNTNVGYVYTSNILTQCIMQNLNENISSSVADIMEISIANMPPDTVKDVYEYKKHTFYSTHYFGDPSMVMYTSIPKCISPTIHKHNDSIVVELDASQYIVTLTSTENPMDMTKFKSFKGLDKVIFKGIDYPATICITRKNHIPYISLTDKYIQNMVFNKDTTVISGQDIYVGQEVTSSISKGSVICKGGKTHIQAQNSIHLKDGFKVDKGAQFKASFYDGSCSYKVFENETPKFANYSLVTNNGEYLTDYIDGESWGTLTELDDNQDAKNQIVLYPNPTDGNITVSFGNEEGGKSVVVTNVSGAILSQGTYHGGNAQINLTGKEAGVYFIHIITNSKSVTKQVIKK